MRKYLLGFFAAIFIFLVRITSSIRYENIDIPKVFWKKKETEIHKK